MEEYKAIGIDLAKRKFHIAAIDEGGTLILKQAISRAEYMTASFVPFAKSFLDFL